MSGRCDAAAAEVDGAARPVAPGLQRNDVKKFYITTAIDYANGDPHIGHALEKIGADSIARYHRLRGYDVHFLMGMDEHGQKVTQAAADRGLSPQALVDEIAATFQLAWARLSISHDQFIRTTEPSHKTGVRALIELIFQRNPEDFYEQAYEGWYCVGCELFKRQDEIVDGKCALHPTRTLEWASERNWFFRLTRYEHFLRRLFVERPRFLEPDSRRNEILALLNQGLEDISVTRSRLLWAIPFPRASSDGEHQGTWVWFDALPNYLTATGFPDDGFQSRWPANLHVIGKDITRLHCVVWPAMLESAGIPLPERVWAHGFVQSGGERLSKSAGVQVELGQAIERYGADAFRYYLLREVPFDGDGSFTFERFEERYTADLANAFGNLASRVISMIERYCGGVVPDSAGADAESEMADAMDFGAYHRSMDGSNGYLPHEALRHVWLTVARANAYVDRKAPWKLAKDPAKRVELEQTLWSLARSLAMHAIHLAPFVPGKAQELWEQLGAPGRAAECRIFAESPTQPLLKRTSDAAIQPLDPAGWRVTKGASLFPREARDAVIT
ncbi:MAG: methionine--tRNA ligase [Gemmatimonadaceae bacterium]